MAIQNIDESAIPIVNPSVQMMPDTNETLVLINTDTTVSITINKSALFLWKLINNKRTIDEILILFQAEFTDPSDQILVDGKQFLERLIQMGFIGFEVKE